MPKATKAPQEKPVAQKAKEEFAKAEEELKQAQANTQAEGEKQEGAGEQTPPLETPEEKLVEEAKVEEEKTKDFGDLYNELAVKKGIKSPEDLATLYVNLEKRASRVESMARETLRRVEESKQGNVAEAEGTDEREEALSLLRQTIQEVVREELTPLRAEQDKKYVDEEISQVQTKYPWFKGQLVNDAVAMMARGEARSLDDAAKILTYDIATAEAQRIAEKEGKTIEKKSAFAESAGSASGSKEVDYESMTLEELEQILPKAGSFIDHKGHLRRA